MYVQHSLLYCYKAKSIYLFAEKNKVYLLHLYVNIVLILLHHQELNIKTTVLPYKIVKSMRRNVHKKYEENY